MGHGSNLTLAQDTEQDYYLHVNRARYKDDARKQRFNLQTVMLIGCYTMLVSTRSASVYVVPVQHSRVVLFSVHGHVQSTW